MVDFIQSGFWQAFLFTVIFGVVGNIIGHVLKKKLAVLAAVFRYAPSAFAFFYVWSIRGHVGWLIFAIIGTITCVVTLIVLIFVKASKKVFKENDTYIESFISSAADEANKHFPKMIDSHTRLDKTVALPNKIFQYQYTLVNLSKEEINQEDLKNRLYTPILNDVKTNSVLKDFRNFKVTMEYVYHDKTGNEVLKLTYGPNDYL